MLIIVKHMYGGTWHADIRTSDARFLRYFYEQERKPTEDEILADWEADEAREFKQWHKCTVLVITSG